MKDVKTMAEVSIAQVNGFPPRQPIPVNVRNRTIPRGSHQAVTVNAATSLTYPVDDVLYVQTKAFITVETADIRYRLDGVNPTTTVGHLAKSDTNITLDSIEEIKGFRAINVSGAAVIQVSYKEVVGTR